MAHHVGVAHGGGDPETDGGEHVAVHPGRRLIAPAEEILQNAVEGHQRPHRDHQGQQGIQLAAGGNGVVQRHGKQDKGHRQHAGQQAGLQIDGEQGARQIDGGVQHDIPVGGGPGQGVVFVPHQHQQQTGIADEGQAQHQHRGAELAQHRGQHHRQGAPEPGLEKDAAGEQPVQVQGLIQPAQAAPHPGPQTEEHAALRRPGHPARGVEEPLHHPAILPLAATPQAQNGQQTPEIAAVQDLFHLFHDSTSL